MNSAVLRELGAEVRTFKTDSGCLLWFVQERARRMGIQVKLESGATPISREAREIQNATYASIAASLTEAAPSDYSFDPPITEERLNQLVHWYLSDEPQQASGRSAGNELGTILPGSAAHKERDPQKDVRERADRRQADVNGRHDHVLRVRAYRAIRCRPQQRRTDGGGAR
jgi:hypothetical protein